MKNFLLKVDKSNFRTRTIYFHFDNDSNKASAMSIFRSIGQIINKVLKFFFNVKLNRAVSFRYEQVLRASKDVREMRDESLAKYLVHYFSELGFNCEEHKIKTYIEEFDKVFRSQPISDLNGGLGYNNAMMVFLFIKIANPPQLIESGVWRGFTTYLFNEATEDTAKIYSFDINLSLTEYKSKKAIYNECDIEQSSIELDDWPVLAFFDDHVSHYDRLNYAIDRGFSFLILDDDLSIQTLHSDAWPPIPTANMLFNYSKIPHQFGWFSYGRQGHADISGLKVNEIVSFYHYKEIPDLFQFTGYRNSSVTSFLVKK